MDEVEKTIREGLQRAVASKPPLGSVDLDEVMARGGPPAPRRGLRWLAVAAAVALVAGLGVGAWSLRGGGATPAVPQVTPAAVPPEAALAGTRWDATTIEGQVVIADDTGTVPYLQFDTDAIARGGDPCNRIGGEYSLYRSSLRFTNWTSREVGCGSGLLVAQQARFQEALRATTSLRLTTATLTLLDASGDAVLVLARAGSTSAGPVSPSPAGLVRIRLRNITGSELDHVRVAFANGGELAFPALADQTGSAAFVRPESMPAVVAIVASAGTREFDFVPRSAEDGTVLAPGSYTYLLDLTDTGDLKLSLVREG